LGFQAGGAEQVAITEDLAAEQRPAYQLGLVFTQKEQAATARFGMPDMVMTGANTLALEVEKHLTFYVGAAKY
jgi:hypothetical protein